MKIFNDMADFLAEAGIAMPPNARDMSAYDGKAFSCAGRFLPAFDIFYLHITIIYNVFYLESPFFNLELVIMKTSI